MQETNTLVGDAVRLFLSYAPIDARLVARMETHLQPLAREGLIQVWGRHQLVAGAPRDETIRTQLDGAEIIAILVSPDYLATDDCYAVEMERALARHEEGRVRVIPVLLRPVVWEGSPLARLACLPASGQPISTHRHRDKALHDVAAGLRRAAIEIRAGRREGGGGRGGPTPCPADRRVERATGRIVTRSRAPRAEHAGVDLYVTSRLFDVTLLERAALDQPAHAMVERIASKLRLPVALNHQNRIGVEFAYRLVLDDKPLDGNLPLAAQGVSAGAVLTLETEVKTGAAIDPADGPIAVSRFRGSDDLRREALAAAREALFSALRAADVAGETTDEAER